MAKAKSATLVTALVFSFLLVSPAAAQTPNAPNPNAPNPNQLPGYYGNRAPGQPQVGAPQGAAAQPTPRLPDGTPNLGRVEIGKGHWALKQHWDYAELLVGDKEIPYHTWAKDLRAYRQANLSKDDPEGFCLPPGGPRAMTTPFPLEIFQMPEQKRIIMIYEGGAHIWREIYMDGRPHPPAETMIPTWTGDSTGHWEGDVLVVDVVGFNEGTWIDGYGDPHTEVLHIIERYSRPNLGTLHYEATIDDPGAYTKPWTIQFDVPWAPNGQIKEYICQENNKWEDRYRLNEPKP